MSASSFVGAPHPDSSRPFIPILVFAAVAVLLLLRLGYLQVIAAPALSAEGEDARMAYDWVEPRRGTIYDRNGVVLATSVESTTIYVDPVEVDDANATAEVLAEVLGGEKSDYLEAATMANTRYALVEKQADVEVGERLRERTAELSAEGGEREGMDFGIRYKTEWRREYPNGRVGGQVIGLCNLEVDTENNREYYVGATGLELYYDDVLAGEAGYTREERATDGTRRSTARTSSSPSTSSCSKPWRSAWRPTKRASRPTAAAPSSWTAARARYTRLRRFLCSIRRTERRWRQTPLSSNA